MTHTESTPTTEPAESLDDLRAQLTFARDLVDALETTIAAAETDELFAEPVTSPSDRDLIDALSVRVDALEQAQQPAQPQPTPFDERALDETDAMLDMTGAFVQSTAVVLAIREAVRLRVEKSTRSWEALQHGTRGERYAAARERVTVLSAVLAEIDTVIAERMS
jgi:hypothetical protein